jgi:hypothetical protein
MAQRDPLPLPDYDHLQTGSLISRIRTLDAAGLQTLLDYEKGHANRIQVVSAMRSRLASLKQATPEPEAEAPDSATDPKQPE